jgi:hypothetical protein
MAEKASEYFSNIQTSDKALLLEKHGQRIELIQSAGGNLSLCPKSGGLPFSGVLKR